MHVFLTGEKQVGKSTIIRRYLEQSGISADGFATFWETDAGARGLYLAEHYSQSEPPEKHLIVREGAMRLTSAEELAVVFDGFGCKILDGAGKRGIIVMDELGFLESMALDFQRSVLRHLSGNVPVLGVIKPARTEFLDAIRSHPNVEVLEVTPENRDEILKSLFSCGVSGIML